VASVGLQAACLGQCDPATAYAAGGVEAEGEPLWQSELERNDAYLNEDRVGQAPSQYSKAQAETAEEQVRAQEVRQDDFDSALHPPVDPEQRGVPARSSEPTDGSVERSNAAGPPDTAGHPGVSGAQELTDFGGSALPGVSTTRAPVAEYDVGSYKELKSRSVVGDQIEIHHVPQAHPAGQVVPGYDYVDAPSIALPTEEHGTIPTFKGSYDGSPQDLLDHDIENLRNLTNAPDESIDQLTSLIGRTYPGSFGGE
jgi:hypothetical protein